ncbi:MAG: DUF493 family protein [Burkholderiaceae bacterium]|nr:DUF493 family protein [Burkholderiaceae bacterium]
MRGCTRPTSARSSSRRSEPPRSAAVIPHDIPPEQSLIAYPSAFPIKVMGLQVEGFVEAMIAVAKQFDPGLDPATVERRPSRGGRYLGLTLTITATSREQLDELYRTLSTHPMVKVVL